MKKILIIVLIAIAALFLYKQKNHMDSNKMKSVSLGSQSILVPEAWHVENLTGTCNSIFLVSPGGTSGSQPINARIFIYETANCTEALKSGTALERIEKGKYTVVYDYAIPQNKESVDRIIDSIK